MIYFQPGWNSRLLWASNDVSRCNSTCIMPQNSKHINLYILAFGFCRPYHLDYLMVEGHYEVISLSLILMMMSGRPLGAKPSSTSSSIWRRLAALTSSSFLSVSSARKSRHQQTERRASTSHLPSFKLQKSLRWRGHNSQVLCTRAMLLIIKH